jgi:hypothetical protein
MRHAPLPPGYARKDLLWMALIVLVLVLWFLAALSGWLVPLGWE